MQRKLKVLCLHGYSQNAQLFREQSKDFCNSLKNLAEFYFLSAPITVPDADESHRCWWRSTFESFSSRDGTDPCEGLETSIATVEQAWRTQGPYDGLVGYSQGACFISLLAALHQRGEIQINPRFTVLFAGFTSSSSRHAGFYASPFQLPSLHVVGEADEVVPESWSHEFLSAFAGSILLKHDGDHFNLGSKSLTNAFISFFQQQASLINRPTV